MSALCCAVPSLMATGGGGGVNNSSSMPVMYHHFNRPMAPAQHHNSFIPSELNSQYRMQQQQQQQQQQLACHHEAVDQFTTTIQASSQQQFVMPQQQAVTLSQQSRASRRKRLEDALTEAIPAASSGKVSQRIAQLQQSLYASCHPAASTGRIIHPSRPLSLDPLKDYCQPLTVDCSIEYDLPRVSRPPPGAKPLLLIARRPPPPPTLPAVRQSPSRQRNPQQPQWNPVIRTATHQALLQQQSSQQFQFRPDCSGYFVMNIAPVSSSSSDDSGRGTDSEQHPSASSPVTSNSYRVATATAHHHPPTTNMNNNWMNGSDPQWTSMIQHQLKYNQHVKPTALPAAQHPRPAEAARARVSMTTTDQSACHCCPSRSNPFPAQRWAPYNTTAMMAARHGCPAPVILQQHNVDTTSWARWNDSSVDSAPYNHPSSSSMMAAFHI